MGKTVNIGDLDHGFYHISYCSREIDIENYHISFLKIHPFEVRKVSIEKSILFDTNS
jgi:hypothetical protein